MTNLVPVICQEEPGLCPPIPKIKRRRSIDVSKIEQILEFSTQEGHPDLIAPSITISQYNSNIGLNRSVISLDNLA